MNQSNDIQLSCHLAMQRRRLKRVGFKAIYKQKMKKGETQKEFENATPVKIKIKFTRDPPPMLVHTSHHRIGRHAFTTFDERD